MGQRRGEYRLARMNAGLVTRGEVAQLMGCTRETLQLAEEAGFLPARSHPGGPVRLLWHESELPQIKAGLERWRTRERKRTCPPPPGLLSIGDLAEELGRPRVTLCDWIQRGLFPRGTVTARGHEWYEVEQLPELRRLYIEMLKRFHKKGRPPRPTRSQKRPRGASSRRCGG